MRVLTGRSCPPPSAGNPRQQGAGPDAGPDAGPLAAPAGGFVHGSGLHAAGRGRLLDAVCLSVVTPATLGLGGIVPGGPWLRIAVPVQALIGAVLLTAAVTGVLPV